MTDRFKNYVPVAERLSDAAMDLAHVETERPEMITDVMGYIRARVALQDGRVATATATFRLDLVGKGAQATNPIEDCETSAVGRALAFLGYSAQRSIATREDVQEAQRREAAVYTPTNVIRPKPSAVASDDAPKATKPADATEARARFFKAWGATAGMTWPDVARWLGTPNVAEPTTVEGWIEYARLIKTTQNERDYDAVDAAAEAA